MSYSFNLNKGIRAGIFFLIFLLRVKIKNKGLYYKPLIFKILTLIRKLNTPELKPYSLI